jgi:hypothetical protein
MKAFIAYALVVGYVPIFFGRIFGTLLTLPVSLIVRLSRKGKETPLTADEATEAAAKDKAAWVFRGSQNMAVGDIIAHICIDVFSGFGALLAAGLLFHFFGLHLGAAVFLIIAAWQILFTVCYRLSFRMLLGYFAGMIIGWFVVIQLFSI